MPGVGASGPFTKRRFSIDSLLIITLAERVSVGTVFVLPSDDPWGEVLRYSLGNSFYLIGASDATRIDPDSESMCADGRQMPID